MSLILSDLTDHIVSHAASTGYFERINRHEPKNAPGYGLSAAVWVDRVTPVKTSGLASTAIKVVFNVRLFSNMIAEPQDSIDANLTDALNALLSAYSGDFTFDGTVMEVDLLGAYGDALQAKAGYLEQDKKIFRVFTITVPVILDNVWSQTA